MTHNHTPGAAKSLAADYVGALNPFVDKLLERVSRMGLDRDSHSIARHRREACAVVWSAIVAALEASSLSEDNRRHFMPLVLDHLLPCWKSHCGATAEATEWLTARSSHYLHSRDRTNQITTAAGMVAALLDAIEVSEATRHAHGRELTAILAHRIITDVGHFNELRSRRVFR